VSKVNGGLDLGPFFVLPKYIQEALREKHTLEDSLRQHDSPDPVPIEDFNVLRGRPDFNITFDLDGKTIGKFWYEDKQLKFEGEVSESAQVWVDWVIAKFMEWHDENIW
jgi:hypothetical protein